MNTRCTSPSPSTSTSFSTSFSGSRRRRRRFWRERERERERTQEGRRTCRQCELKGRRKQQNEAKTTHIRSSGGGGGGRPRRAGVVLPSAAASASAGAGGGGNGNGVGGEQSSKGRKEVRLLCTFVFCCVVLLVQAATIGLVDDTEPLFVEAARQMTVTGDWVTPYFNEQVRFDKPILLYWIMALSLRVFGVSGNDTTHTHKVSLCSK